MFDRKKDRLSLMAGFGLLGFAGLFLLVALLIGGAYQSLLIVFVALLIVAAIASFIFVSIGKKRIRLLHVETADDYRHCLHIRREVFVKELGFPLSEEVDEFEQDADHFLVFIGNEAVSTARFRIRGDLVKFERVATLKEYRGKGLGTELIKMMQVYAQENFSQYLPMMHAQVPAIVFYERLGWKVASKTFDEQGIPHKIMILPPTKSKERLLCLKNPDTSKEILEVLNND